MAFEEVFLYNVGKRLTSNLEGDQGHRNAIIHSGLARLSYEKQIVLNDEQERVFSEIRRDMFSRTPMRRARRCRCWKANDCIIVCHLYPSK